jgi:hypothetical protein
MEHWPGPAGSRGISGNGYAFTFEKERVAYFGCETASICPALLGEQGFSIRWPGEEVAYEISIGSASRMFIVYRQCLGWL